jgi:LacI family transcriptional regulator
MTTIKDVAKTLNISITTVSRALDGYSDVSAETRQRVIDAARIMGYSPNRAARQLRKQKSETIGFILPASALRFDEPFFTEFVSGLGDSLSRNNYDLLVANATSDEQECYFYNRWINGHKVDGMVLNRLQVNDWRIKILTDARFPFTTLGKTPDSKEYPHVLVDGSQAYLELIQHLQAHGFTRIAFIGGPPRLINHQNQVQWIKTAIQNCGLPFDPELILSAELNSSSGYSTASQLLELSKPPDAILCINDETAFGTLSAAHAHGLNIGKEIAIAGFDGVHESRFTEPPLTTLDIPLFDIAQLLADMLLEKINGNPLEVDEVTIHPNLLVRASTGG